jgi:hypothetical protein
MTKNIENSTGEIEALAAELAELAKEGGEAKIASLLIETKTRWREEALRDDADGRDLAWLEYQARCKRLAAGNMDNWSDEEIEDLAREAKTRGLTFDAACDEVIGRFFDDLDDDDNPIAIAPDHWRAHRARQAVMEVYRPRQPEEAAAKTRPWSGHMPF